jgi:predicted hotdog family 3-hydroxylacyl-ACP dehydratase
VIDKSALEQLIPHGQQMCLLDKVLNWDGQHIVCETKSHLSPDNPMLEEGRMEAVALVEYGAQAAAVHAALVQNGVGEHKLAYLGAIKQLELRVNCLDKLVGPLFVEANCELNNENGAIYSIAVKSLDQLLIEGRIILIQPG